MIKVLDLSKPTQLTEDLVVFVRRQERPEVEFSQFIYIKNHDRWELVGTPLPITTEAKDNFMSQLNDAGYTRLLDWMGDRPVRKCVKNSCPIAFNDGLKRNHPSIIGRITVMHRTSHRS